MGHAIVRSVTNTLLSIFPRGRCYHYFLDNPRIKQATKRPVVYYVLRCDER